MSRERQRTLALAAVLCCASWCPACDRAAPPRPEVSNATAHGGPSSIDTTAQPHAVTVELDIYSGRPNPQWTLTVPETQYLLNALSTAAPRATHRPLTMPLGYRGFVIGMKRHSGTQILRIANGVIEMTGHNGTTQFDDHNRTLERWLLLSAAPHVDAADLKSIALKLH